MDEADQKRQLIDGQTEGTGRLRDGVEYARGNADDGPGGTGRARPAVEDVAWFLREHVAWPIEDSLERLGRRGAIGVFGGGGIAVAGVVAALVIASPGGSSADAGITEAFVSPQRAPARAPAAAAPTAAPKVKAPKPTGPTLHGAPPDFFPAKDVKAGVGDGKVVDGKRATGNGEAPAQRGSGGGDVPGSRATGGGGGAGAAGATTSSKETPASTARIGSTAEADAGAAGPATGSAAGATGAEQGRAGAQAVEPNAGRQEGTVLTGPPAPKAAKQVARHFAEAFVVYEIGGIDAKVRKAFDQTGTKQLSRSLLRRPPRQPAKVKVPQAKVVNVVAGPSKGKVYTVSVSLLRVGVTSELRLEMEQGAHKKWQVTNVLG
ncbi:MAG: hypothetical protein JST08_07390 [Actinobacteria bacterium]|nr:hypothetical protein [Actinomycetota bacterium]